MDAVNCPLCGTENPSNATHCTNCRVNLRLARRDPDEIERVKQEPIRRREGKTPRETASIAAKAGLAVLTVAGLATAFALLGSDNRDASVAGEGLRGLFLVLWIACAIWAFIELDRVFPERTSTLVHVGCIASDLVLVVFVPIAPLVLVVLAFLPDAVHCPYCERRIPQKAVKCPHCHADLTTSSVPGHPDLSGF